MTSTQRVLIVLRRLQKRWSTIAELADLVDRDPKTIRRDLKAIGKAGFRLRFQTEGRGLRRWRAK